MWQILTDHLGTNPFAAVCIASHCELARDVARAHRIKAVDIGRAILSAPVDTNDLLFNRSHTRLQIIYRAARAGYGSVRIAVTAATAAATA